MKKRTLVIFGLVSVISLSCKKESVSPNNDEIEQFLNQTEIQFNGTVLGNGISWVFENWNTKIGFNYGSAWGFVADTTIQNRSCQIFDTEEIENICLLKIISPAFCIDSSYIFKKSIFEIGKKQFNSSTSSIYEGFVIEASSKIESYSTYFGNQENSSFEIIKTQELTPSDPEQNNSKKLKLWIVFSCNLYTDSGQKTGEIKDGKFIGVIEVEPDL